MQDIIQQASSDREGCLGMGLREICGAANGRKAEQALGGSHPPCADTGLKHHRFSEWVDPKRCVHRDRGKSMAIEHKAWDMLLILPKGL